MVSMIWAEVNLLPSTHSDDQTTRHQTSSSSRKSLQLDLLLSFGDLRGWTEQRRRDNQLHTARIRIPNASHSHACGGMQLKRTEGCILSQRKKG
jgi:hypothetical protein